MELRNKWVDILNYLNNKLKDTDDYEEISRSGSTVSKRTNKLVNVDKGALEILQNSGFSVTNNQEEELSKKCLTLKNITKGLLDVNNPEIKSRVQFGFLYKRHKAQMEYYQKRWMFMISSRPVTDMGYENDDTMLDDKKIPTWMTFDTLYYYTADSDTDASDIKGKIIMK